MGESKVKNQVSVVVMDYDHIEMAMRIGMKCEGQVHHVRREKIDDKGRHLNVEAADILVGEFQKDVDFYYNGLSI